MLIHCNGLECNVRSIAGNFTYSLRRVITWGSCSTCVSVGTLVSCWRRAEVVPSTWTPTLSCLSQCPVYCCPAQNQQERVMKTSDVFLRYFLNESHSFTIHPRADNSACIHGWKPKHLRLSGIEFPNKQSTTWGHTAIKTGNHNTAWYRRVTKMFSLSCHDTKSGRFWYLCLDTISAFMVLTIVEWYFSEV